MMKHNHHSMIWLASAAAVVAASIITFSTTTTTGAAASASAAGSRSFFFFVFFANAYVTPPIVAHNPYSKQQQQQQQQQPSSSLFLSQESSSTSSTSTSPPSSSPLFLLSVDQALQSRYACTRFQRFDGIRNNTTTTASISNTTVVQAALQALDVARRAPSGFNAQPYKLLVVSDPQQKQAMAQYCIGRNAHRVRDSDCTVLFLADRQSMRELKHYRTELLFSPRRKEQAQKWKDKNSKWALLKIQVLVGMFSQGWPFPHCISGPISWTFRLAMRVASWMTRRRLVLPTLTSAETWSQKNTMLVAMAYLLACTSRNLATCPMEGYSTWGIRRALQIPRRYTIPLIVATGTPYHHSGRPTTTTTTTTDDVNDIKASSSDDAGMSHGTTPETATLRYPTDQVIFQNHFRGPRETAQNEEQE